MSDRTILHCDCNGFFASVECLLHPEFQNVPMAVCGDPEARHGIILAKNELAKKYGIQTAETIWQARKKCPQLVLAPSHHCEYEKYSRQINEIYQRYTDLVEPFSIDESWLDVTGSAMLFGDGKHIADELRRVVHKETGLTISVGVSYNKIYAKMGSDYKKPDATTVITRENVNSILFPLPVGNLLFVGKNAKAELERMGVHTIGDLASMDRETLCRRFGKAGGDLYDSANGLDESPVTHMDDQREIKSVGNSMTFKRDLVGEQDIRLGVITLADSVAARMRRHGLKCATVQVLIKNPSFQSISRQKGLQSPTYLAKDLMKASMELISASWNMKAPIRMLSITGTNLVPADGTGEQLSLFQQNKQNDTKKQEHLETALDTIRGKFGQEALSPAAALKNDLGIHTGHRFKG